MRPTVGVDLGGTRIRAVAFDDELAPAGRAEAPTGAGEGVEAVVSRVAGCVTEALGGEAPAGVGVGSAGLIDPWRGRVVLASNLGWRDVPLRDLLAAALGGATVRVDMDTNAAALAEARVGAARGLRHLLYVTVGTIKAHTSNIYAKLQARNRAEALARARELGMLA